MVHQISVEREATLRVHQGAGKEADLELDRFMVVNLEGNLQGREHLYQREKERASGGRSGGFVARCPGNCWEGVRGARSMGSIQFLMARWSRAKPGSTHLDRLCVRGRPSSFATLHLGWREHATAGG